MSAADEVVLRYFDCRSRGQALRFALADAGVEFADERVPLEALVSFRERAASQPGYAGPFGSLPLLEWRGHEVAQTLAIASFLGAELGIDGGSDRRRRSRLDMVTNAAHLDMQVPYRELLWRRADLADERLAAIAQALRNQLVGKTRQLEAAFEANGPFFGGAEPAMADYFVFESLDRACSVFGDSFEAELEERPGMQALRAAMSARPRIADFVEGGGVPFSVTASPSERTLRERLQPI